MPLFGKLSDDKRGRVSRVLAAVRREATGARPTKPVRIKLGELSAPLRAVVRDESDGGILIEAELPWLTVGSAVQAEFTDGREKAGRVQWFGVDATRAGAARLRIFVDLSSDSGPIGVELPDVGGVGGRRGRWPWILATALVVLLAASLAYLLLRRSVKPAMLPSPVATAPASPHAHAFVAIPRQPPEAPSADATTAPARPPSPTAPKKRSTHAKRGRKKR